MKQPESRADDSAASDTHDSSGDLDLAERASAALNQQCNAAHDELTQTQQLLSDATRRLLDCFHEMQRELVAAGTAQPEPVARSLLAATQHLQFSDLVGQLLATTGERVDALAQLSQRLQNLVQAMSALRNSPNAQVVALADPKRAFVEALITLESCGNSRVRQSDMRAGDVDLF